jgi:hypothetical protein
MASFTKDVGSLLLGLTNLDASFVACCKDTVDAGVHQPMMHGEIVHRLTCTDAVAARDCGKAEVDRFAVR